MVIPVPFLADIPIDQVGYLALFIIMLLDGANLPFTPNELFLGLAGYLVAIGELNFIGALVVTVAGNVAGAIISYVLGYVVGRPFFARYGKYFLITPERLASAEDRAKEMGPSAAFVFRLIPGLRTFGSVLLGVVRMNFGSFILLTTFGVAIWNAVFLILGFYFGVAFSKEAAWIVPLLIGVIAGGLCLTAVAWYTQMTLRKRKSRRESSTV